MAIAFVQAQNNNGGGSSLTVLSAAFSSSVTSGNLIVVALSHASGVPSGVTLTDTQGNTYTSAVTPTFNSAISGGFTDYIYYAVAGSTGANTVTVTLGQVRTFIRLIVHEYSGVNTFDVSASNSGASGAPNSGSATTNFANELIFGWGLSNDGTASAGAGAGFTFHGTTTNATGESTEDMIVSSTGSYSAIYPTGTGSAWMCQMATFYMLGGGGGNSATIAWFRA